MIDFGNSYNELPTLTITSSSGNGAKVLAYGTEIGRALQIKVVEAGYNYADSPALTIKFNVYLYTSLSGTLTEDETVRRSSSVTVLVVSIDTTKQIIKLKNHSGTFTEGETINFSGGVQ